jgi:hypothetical protein
MEPSVNEQTHIKGWGIDADRENEPTYPMKKYTGDDHKRTDYERPPLQQSAVEILKSTERPSLSAVYGTSTPPSGLSGMIRRYAFKFSEGSWGHWLPLILADRINVWEGIIDDLQKGHIPNFIKERGWSAEWKYNRKGVIQKVAIGVAVTTAVVAIVVLRNKSKRSKPRRAY